MTETGAEKGTAIALRDVTRHFGKVRAVDGIDLDIAEGEFFSMLGPSGSGKTTCLRLIAGFEQPDAGAIELFGERVEALPPYRRAVNTVFQDYALFPHMDVLDNVAYGLRMKGFSRAERHVAARDALAMVRLEGMEHRRPRALSGGQRQRVALARALANRPRVLLLDEPLGALDLKLREEMQVELKTLQRRLGLTFVFVTHDQTEALAMSDRVAVFANGRMVQVGTPDDIYERPRDAFVARFVGSANVLDAIFCTQNGFAYQAHCVRAERIALGGDAAVQVDGVCVDVQYQGAVRRLVVDASGQRLTAQIAAHGAPVSIGEAVTLSWPRQAMHPLQPERA